MRAVRTLTAAVVVLAIAFAPRPVVAQGPEAAITKRIAVWRFDALGIDPELVARLETLFRMELDRLAVQPMPTRREIDRAITGDARECTGEERCLGAIGKRLGVDIVVTGTVGALGDNYVLDVKAVDAATAKQITRIQSAPLSGSPDELIEGVRVAAYRLLAPSQLHGAVQIQTDLVAAEVELDGKRVGKTPLPRLGLLDKQQLGKHKLRVRARGYTPFEEEIEIRFQKVSQVVVRMLPADGAAAVPIPRAERRPFYSRGWFIAGAAVAAVAVGAYAGWRFGRTDCVRIGGMGTDC